MSSGTCSADLKAAGLTILVSTPYMDEANRCDRVALMQRGQLLAVDTPEAITRSFDRPLLAVRADDRYRALLALRDYPHTHTVYPFGECCTTPTRGPMPRPVRSRRNWARSSMRAGFTARS